MSDRSPSPSLPQLPGLRGARVLVTGASRGIGRATALLLAASGADVAIGYRTRREAADEVVDAARALGVRAFAHAADLGDPDAAEGLVGATVAAFGGLDAYVGNAGIWPPDEVPFADMAFAQWRRTMTENVDAIFHVTRAAVRAMGDGGRVVLVASTAAQRGEAFHADYAASKGAMVSLVKSLAVELGPRGITVNAVAPGWVATEMTAGVLAGPALDRAAAGIPIGRVATADDIAAPIVFLCTPMARHVTGEILNVNGGSVLCG